MKARNRIKVFLVSFVILLIVGYSLSRSYNLILGPSIKIAEPQSGVTITDPVVKISGKAARIAKLSLNNRQIFTDEKGQFNEILLMGEGYNILTMRAEDRFGRRVRKIIELVYQPPTTGTTTPVGQQ